MWDFILWLPRKIVSLRSRGEDSIGATPINYSSVHDAFNGRGRVVNPAFDSKEGGEVVYTSGEAEYADIGGMASRDASDNTSEEVGDVTYSVPDKSSQNVRGNILDSDDEDEYASPADSIASEFGMSEDAENSFDEGSIDSEYDNRLPEANRGASEVNLEGSDDSGVIASDDDTEEFGFGSGSGSESGFGEASSVSNDDAGESYSGFGDDSDLEERNNDTTNIEESKEAGFTRVRRAAAAFDEGNLEVFASLAQETGGITAPDIPGNGGNGGRSNGGR